MCGIWFLYNAHDNTIEYDKFTNIQYRGPDCSKLVSFGNFHFGFHRLSIINTHISGMQPFIYEDENRRVVLICNGEIYNYKDLSNNTTLRSDCDVILELYLKYGIYKCCELIKGEFAFVIYDNNMVYACRDTFGIRPLYYSKSKSLDFLNISSELKGLTNNNSVDLEAIRPNYIYEFNTLDKTITMTQNIVYIPIEYNNDTSTIKNLLIESVKKRLMTDRPLGCLLSGGLDSSLVASIASNILKEKGLQLNTFSIGMENSSDAIYANIVAKHINSNHRHIFIEHTEWLKEIKNVIKIIESYDITTVRASCGQYMISKWIRENTDIKVLLIGDGSDELCSGYMYFHSAPSPIDAHNENVRLLNDISKYDVKRSDAGVSSNGLEARVPYLDLDFVMNYLSINPEYRVPLNGIEKYLLRKSFDDADNTLPKEVLYRKKEAFSDGVSGKSKSWYEIIQDYCNTLYTDDELLEKQKKYTHNTPHTKEALFYRETYETLYPNTEHLIPYFWLPKWVGNVTEPSARVLDAYKK